MSRRAFLGIDCGTQSTKALLVDADNDAVLGVGRAAHELIEAEDGTREQHPDWWVAALVEATRGALGAAGNVEVAGIGVSGQQHGLVCLNGDDRPVRTAKLWNDTTTAEECALLTSRLGGAERVLELTGNIVSPGVHRAQGPVAAAARAGGVCVDDAHVFAARLPEFVVDRRVCCRAG